MSSSTLLMLPAGSSSSSGVTSASMGTTGGRGSILHASMAVLQGHSLAVQLVLQVLYPSYVKSEWLARRAIGVVCPGLRTAHAIC